MKRQAGRSFKELLILQRMYQACFLLSNTELPIYEIAQKVGYNNLGFFYHKFEAVYHVSPAEYRARQREAQHF
ncbi:MAG TPA: helix-turn-helix domain-containing protein [Subdoligranulum variabile]|uniref:Helix-turn-helix domain-containing protein n=1 Tax=Subdoligranulum variabile TaxID=214851 RepID=A0A921IHC9_9FIRM|nr:helix-turn-helix domain-containing protein [Subdoligranulum variabile]